jgi:hypothetical protein
VVHRWYPSRPCCLIVNVTQLGIRELCSQPSYLRGDSFGTETQVWWPTLSRHPFSVPTPLFFRFASALRALNDFFFRFLVALGDFDGPVSAHPPRVTPVRPSRSPPMSPSKTVLPPMLPVLPWVLLVALVAAHPPHVSPVRPCLVSGRRCCRVIFGTQTSGKRCHASGRRSVRQLSNITTYHLRVRQMVSGRGESGHS